MDFGALGLNGFVGSDNGGAPDTKTRIFGSGLAKHERSSGSAQDDWRSLKMTRTDDVAAPKTMPFHQVAPLLRSNSFASGDTRQQEYMLSFSALKPDAASFLSTNSGLTERSTQNHTGLPHYQLKTSAYARSSGYGGGSLNGNLHVPFTGVTGSFTPSQWMELEHQALIYKHIANNVPVPSNLVIPFKKPLYAYGLASSSTGSFPTNPLGWPSFPLGYSGNSSDLEPKRCRRTDGKKWRCSRDAVADQKYCERHLNRGRHRSRKPVEGQTGHAATGTTNSKVVPMTTSMSTLIRTSGGASKSLAISHQQFKNSQPAAPHSSADAFVNRLILSKVNDIGREQDLQGKSMVSSTLNLKSDGSTLTIPKQGIRTEGWSPSELGLISFDSLGNPPLRVSYISSKSYESILNRNDPKAQDQDPTHQLTDDWPKDLSNHSLISWPEELKSDCTQLSMSIPMVSADFLSSSSSPTREKCVLSPLRLSRKVDPIQIGLGARGDHSESSQKLNNWMPISWGSSMGNPLGEVLTASTGSLGSWKNSSALNLLTEGWDDRPQLGSSPTGVLQKATFVSLSNSSSGSTRTESKNNNG